MKLKKNPIFFTAYTLDYPGFEPKLRN